MWLKKSTYKINLVNSIQRNLFKELYFKKSDKIHLEKSIYKLNLEKSTLKKSTSIVITSPYLHHLLLSCLEEIWQPEFGVSLPWKHQQAETTTFLHI